MVQITSDLVLSESGISKGSLYHHFADFSELIEHAQVAIFTELADSTLIALQGILRTAQTREEFLVGIRTLTHGNLDADRKAARLARIQGIALASSNGRMAKAMGEVQLRTTEGVADFFREAREKGWSNNDLDLYAVALFVQSYNFGPAIDALAPDQMDFEEWLLLIDSILSAVILE